MKSKLNQKEADILGVGVYIAKKTKLFPLGVLSKNWSISRGTLLRYTSVDYRELSRRVARAATERNKQVDRTVCHKCLEPLENHARCPHCTILTHGERCNCIDISLYYKLLEQL